MAKQEFVWPSTAQDQKELKEKIGNAANLMGELDVIKSDIGTLAEEAKDKFGISAAEFKKYASAEYDKEKFRTGRDKLNEISDNLGL